ncbi:MAG: hypothetical protein M3Z04_15190 [Chloroflexota bacterium]|nr:hypothetical protein [Chloroflexota bacterium]
MADDARAEYDAIVADLCANADVTSGKAFSMPCLKHAGKVLAGFYHGAMVFKLGATEHAAALALAGAHPFDPSGAGRPWKEWVVVPSDHAAQWPALAREALYYLTSTL